MYLVSGLRLFVFQPLPPTRPPQSRGPSRAPSSTSWTAPPRALGRGCCGAGWRGRWRSGPPSRSAWTPSRWVWLSGGVGCVCIVTLAVVSTHCLEGPHPLQSTTLAHLDRTRPPGRAGARRRALPCTLLPPRGAAAAARPGARIHADEPRDGVAGRGGGGADGAEKGAGGGRAAAGGRFGQGELFAVG